jgi:hypothetical protein
MISNDRQQVLTLLRQLSELVPDMRFGQLVANLSYRAIGPTNEAIWDMEDAELIAAIRAQIDDLSDRKAEVA